MHYLFVLAEARVDIDCGLFVFFKHDQSKSQEAHLFVSLPHETNYT